MKLNIFLKPTLAMAVGFSSMALSAQAASSESLTCISDGAHTHLLVGYQVDPSTGLTELNNVWNEFDDEQICTDAANDLDHPGRSKMALPSLSVSQIGHEYVCGTNTKTGATILIQQTIDKTTGLTMSVFAVNEYTDNESCRQNLNK